MNQSKKKKIKCPGCCFSIKMPSYQYSISNHENKTVTWPSYTYDENLYTQKDMFVMKLCLAGFFQIMVQIMYGFHNHEQWHTLSDVANMLSRIDELNATTSIVSIHYKQSDPDIVWTIASTIFIMDILELAHEIVSPFYNTHCSVVPKHILLDCVIMRLYCIIPGNVTCEILHIIYVCTKKCLEGDLIICVSGQMWNIYFSGSGCLFNINSFWNDKDTSINKHNEYQSTFWKLQHWNNFLYTS